MNTTTPAQQGNETVSLTDEAGVRRILVDTVFGLWGIVNNLTRLRPAKRERYRVTIFGSARAKPGTWVYEEVKRLSGELAALGFNIVTGVDEAIAILKEDHARWQLAHASSSGGTDPA